MGKPPLRAGTAPSHLHHDVRTMTSARSRPHHDVRTAADADPHADRVAPARLTHLLACAAELRLDGPGFDGLPDRTAPGPGGR